MRTIKQIGYLFTLLVMPVASYSTARPTDTKPGTQEERVVCIQNDSYVQSFVIESIDKNSLDFSIKLRSPEGKPAGHLGGAIIRTRDDKQVGECSIISIFKGYENKGLTTYLCQQAIRYFKRHGCTNEPIQITHTGVFTYIKTISPDRSLNVYIINAENNAQIGYIKTSMYPDNSGFIDLLSVEKRFRHQGLGSSLFKTAVSSLIAQGCKKIEWHAMPFEEPSSSEESAQLNYRKAMARLVAWYKTLGGTVVRATPEKTVMELIAAS